MSSRRSGKTGRSLVDGSAPMTMQEAADLTYGDYALLEEADRNRIFRHPVHPDDLKIDPEIQVRVKGLDPVRVEELKQVLLNGGHFKDPIRAFRDDEGNLWLSAGFRRTEATRQALLEAPPGMEIAPLICEDCPGGRAAAIEDAENDNLKHGEPLSAEDKRALFRRRFVRGHEWFSKNWSNNQIAAELAVNEITIRRWRSSLTSTNVEVRESKGEKASEKRVGADGREYRVDRLQKAAQRRAKLESIPRPAPAGADSGEPTGKWQDEHPAQPRGLYRQTASPAARTGTTDDSVPLEQDEKRWVVDQLRKLAGMVGEYGELQSARTLIGEANALAKNWGIGR